MQARIIKIVITKLSPSYKSEDKLIAQIKKETPKPIISTESDSKTIIIEALTWL